MKSVLKVIYITCILSFLFSLNLNGQSDIIYSDFSIDYYPRIKIIGHENGQIAGSIEKDEFIVSLKTLIGRLNVPIDRIEALAGMAMLSGTGPKVLFETDKWLTLEIDNTGKVRDCRVYDSPARYDEALSERLFKLLNSCTILPALKNGIPVACQLHYTLWIK